MTNCPNCGAPIEPYKTKCDYCGTYYFDFTSIDLTQGKKCFIKLNTPLGEITSLARFTTASLEPIFEIPNIFYNVEIEFELLNNPENNTTYTITQGE